MERDPQPYDHGEESYLAFVMRIARCKAEAEEQEAARRATEQGSWGYARRD